MDLMHPLGRAGRIRDIQSHRKERNPTHECQQPLSKHNKTFRKKMEILHVQNMFLTTMRHKF